MNHLLRGLFFLLLDVYWTPGTAEFDLLPDFIGLFLMMKGMKELAREDRAFDRGRHGAFGLCIVSAILYGANLLDLEPMAQVGMWLGELAALAGQLVLTALMARGICRMEQNRGWDLRSGRLRMTLTVLAVFALLSHLFSWLPVVGNICWVGELMAGFLFLWVFRDSRKRYLAEIA